MKRLLYFLLVLFIPFIDFAQSSEIQESNYRHHIELSFGEPFSSLWGLNMQFRNNLQQDQCYHIWDVANRPAINVGYADEYFVLPITVGYYYQILDWLQIGGEISTMSAADVRNTWGGDKLAEFLQTNLYVSTGVRFNYYSKNITDLYSGLLLGANVRFLSSDKDHLLNAGGMFTWQLTALGVRFGRRIYGNVELGYGYKGLLSVGIGSRF